MTKDGMDRREAISALLALSGGLLAACAAEGEGLLESPASAFQAAKTPAELYVLRERCTKFWNMDNVVRIDIEMDKAEWTALKAELPAITGAPCHPVYDYTYDAFVWHRAKSVTITASGTGKYPANPITVSSAAGIGIKKKSWCGSFSTDKPCLKLDFGEFNDDAAKNKIEQAIGTTRLTLNNCKQDLSFIRQPLGYFLFGLGELPHARCNFCAVYVKTGPNASDVEFMGIYLNIEPIHSRFLDNNFGTVATVNGVNTLTRKNGNLYELEAGDDFTSDFYVSVTPEACSKLNEKDYPKLTHDQRIMDFAVASSELARGNVTGLTNAVVIDQFIRFMAMEFMLKHFDGYTQGRNNTYVYNDVEAVVTYDANGVHFPEAPADVRFKFIPWGLDYILVPGFNFHISEYSAAGRDVVRNPETLAMLKTQVQTYVETIFTRARLDPGGDIAAFIDKMEAILKSLPGVPADLTTQINSVREQLKLVRSAAFMFCGVPAYSLYVLSATNGECLHPSSAETIAGISGAYELVHQAPANSTVDRWYFTKSPIVDPVGEAVPRFRINSREYTSHPYLHCSSAVSPAGHKYIYTTGTDDSNNARDINAEPHIDQNTCDNINRPCSGIRVYSGYFTLQSYRTGQYFCFGTDDLTASGRQRIYQTADRAKATLVRWY